MGTIFVTNNFFSSNRDCNLCEEKCGIVGILWEKSSLRRSSNFPLSFKMQFVNASPFLQSRFILPLVWSKLRRRIVNDFFKHQKHWWYVFGGWEVVADETCWNSTLQWRTQKHCRKSISFTHSIPTTWLQTYEIQRCILLKRLKTYR